MRLKNRNTGPIAGSYRNSVQNLEPPISSAYLDPTTTIFSAPVPQVVNRSDNSTSTNKMVDSLSANSTGVVARAATSAAEVASTLYTLLSDIRDPPREIKDVAGGVHDLANGLRELRNVLQKVDRTVFRSGVFASIYSLSDRIQSLLEIIRGLADLETRDDAESTICAVWRNKAGGIVGKIVSLNLAARLVVTLMSLVSEQDIQAIW